MRSMDAAGLLVLAAVAAAPASAQDGNAERRAGALVAQMTPDEKADFLLSATPAIPRLGIPAYQWWNEGLHGVLGEPRATSYPQAIGLAATFDAPLLQRVARGIATELRAIGDRNVALYGALGWPSGRDAWSPNINIFRDPRWGRGQETYGEDPFLTARMGVAYITGLQGPNPAAPIIIATPKHYAVHSGPEPTRHRDDNIVSIHDLRDTYLPAFRAAVTEAKAGSIMCSYNAVNGQPACANTFLLGDTLRRDWGFKGYVVTDCGAIDDLSQTHKYVTDAPAAIATAITAGVDLECALESMTDPASFGKKRLALEALRRGALSQPVVDRAVTRTLAARIATGEFAGDRGGRVPEQVVNSAAHRVDALKAAEESLVLLKNDGILPLQARRQRIAVVGTLADARRFLRGSYNFRETSALPSVVEGLRAALPRAEVTLVPAGESITDGDIVPQANLRSEDDRPGVTVRYFPALPDGKPAAKSMGEAFGRALSMKVAAEPVRTRTEPVVNIEMPFAANLLPQGGRIEASGFLVPTVSGSYRVGVSGFLNTLTFDGKPFAKTAATIGAGPPSLATVQLEAGRRYPFKIVAPTPRLAFAALLWQRVSPDPEAALRAAAEQADAIVAVVGITPFLEGEEVEVKAPGFKGGDRTSLELPADQLALLAVAKATGKPLVVVNMSGSAVNLDWVKTNAAAVVQAWYPGEAGGTAVGRVLAGRANPSGRLPVTFYRDVAQLPAFESYAMQGRTYRYFAGTPVYGFGYGLSYTSFAYAPLTVARVGDDVRVTTQIRNTGKRTGDEVAQLYLDFPDAPGTPRLALRGFRRVSLAPGERRGVTFVLTPGDMSSVSPDGAIRVLAGTYGITVGSAQPDSGLPGASGTVTIAETRALPN